MANKPIQATPTTVLPSQVAITGFNSRVVGSVVESLREFQKANVVDMTALHESAKAMDPIVAPKVASQIAASLAGIEQRIIASSPNVDFAKTLGDLNVATIQPRFAESVAESLRRLGLANTFSAGIADMLRDLPRVAPVDFAPRVEEAAEEALALAEVEDVAEIVDDTYGGLYGLPPAQRRMLALDVAVLIVAFLFLASWLSEAGIRDDPKGATLTLVNDPHGAGLALAFAAAFVRVYWRLTGKLDER